MMLEQDVDGESKVCLQCGYREYLGHEKVVRRSVPQDVPNPHYAPKWLTLSDRNLREKTKGTREPLRQSR